MILVGNLSTFSGLFALPSFCDAIGKDHGILNGLMSASTNGKMLWWCEKHWGFGGDTKKNLLSTDNQKNRDNRAIKFRSKLWRILGVWRCWKKKGVPKKCIQSSLALHHFHHVSGVFFGVFFLAELDSVRKPDDDCQLQGELPKKKPFKLFISSFL